MGRAPRGASSDTATIAFRVLPLRAGRCFGDDGMAIVDVPRIAAAIAKQFARKVWDIELMAATRVYRGSRGT